MPVTPVYTTPTNVTAGEADSGKFNTETVDNIKHLFLRGPYICTVATRPAGPTEGDTIYETDTDKLRAYNGTAWATVAYCGNPDTWTPAVLNNGQAAVTKTVTHAWYKHIGKHVEFSFRLDITGASAGTGAILASIPVTAARAGDVVGTGWFFDASSNTPSIGASNLLTTTQVDVIRDQSTGNTAVATQLANGDIFWVSGKYETATIG